MAKNLIKLTITMNNILLLLFHKVVRLRQQRYTNCQLLY